MFCFVLFAEAEHNGTGFGEGEGEWLREKDSNTLSHFRREGKNKHSCEEVCAMLVSLKQLEHSFTL